MIIILDEIDALTKTDYSDQIFSQIRSIYFASRVNYKEFNNLTYLLSGVIEPNEIIKDSKISPFNIGQKIYLNDFSREEFEKFLNLSNLNLPEVVTDRIFYWTNGNPRMTWDVCSDVENYLKRQPITVELIDKIVNDLYLTAYDKPPIDNIREMVKHDREIRNSIIEIEFKKGKNISGKIKSKLYLAGIINYDDDDIHIKNEIIRRSLSYAWVRELEEEDKGLIKIALEEYEKLEYAASLSTFEKYLKDNKFSASMNGPFYYQIMGQCAFFLKIFSKAIDYFSQANFDIEDQEGSYYEILYLKGLTYYYLNKLDESLDCFKSVINHDKKDMIYARALLNYGSVSLKSDKITQNDEAAAIFEKIINGTAFTADKLKNDFINELKTIAYYNLAQIYNLKGDNSRAVDNFKQAIAHSKSISKPKIILALLEITNDLNEKRELLNQLIDLISVGKIKPREEDINEPMDFSFDTLRKIAIHAFLNFRPSLFLQIKPYLTLLNENEKSIPKHLYDLAVYTITKSKDWETAIKLLNEAHESCAHQNIDDNKETKYKILKLLAYHTDGKISQTWQTEYLSMFEKERLEAIDFMDITIFASTISKLTEKKKYSEALKYVNLINSVKESIPENNLKDFLVICHFELNLHILLNNRSKALSKAREIVSLVDDGRFKEQKSNLLSEASLDIIKQNAESVVYPLLQNSEQIRTGKTYGRNEIVRVRYKDGITRETKFKKVEDDIKAGTCFILAESSMQKTNLLPEQSNWRKKGG